MARSKQMKMTLHMPDELSVKEARLILLYEASVRGLSLGQACSELVRDAIDIDAYPPEIKGKLAEITQESRQRAVEKLLGEDPATETSNQ